MGYLIKGAKNIAAFKQDLIDSKYGIFPVERSKGWDTIVSEKEEVGLSNEENNTLEVIVFVEGGQFKDERFQQMTEKYGSKL